MSGVCGKRSNAAGYRRWPSFSPPDVTWRPIAADGQPLHGTQELDEFWSSREVAMLTLRMFQAVGMTYS
jgi:hypothetical protein